MITEREECVRRCLNAAANYISLKRMVAAGAVVVLGGIASVVHAAVMPLEWNRTYDTDVPYEVEFSPERIAKLGGTKATADYIVRATLPGGTKTLPVTVMKGRLPRTFALRFKVPAGTTALSCETGKGKVALTDAATVDNLFAGAVEASSAAKWNLTAGGKASADPKGGIVLAATKAGDLSASYAVDVPEKLAGQPVFIEIDIENVAKMTSGSLMCIDQLDAAGKVLPEALSDPRWLSHMRPVGKLQRLREEGRLHPKARRLCLRLSLRDVGGRTDEYGLPLKSPSDTWPALRLTRLAVRPAARLPFPKYDDALFVAGASGEAGDTALVLGDDKAFWYDTHSRACWSQAKQFEDESEVFYPDRTGTVEAWLRPSWTADDARTFNLFTASHRYNSNEARNIQPKYDAMTLTYAPAKGVFAFVIRDWANKSFKGTAKAAFAPGAWHHVAVQWDPSRAAELYVDGRLALSVPLKDFEEWNLRTRTEVKPNARIPLEFYIGANYVIGRVTGGFPAPGKSPFFAGAIDDLRVSSGCRYRGDFTPAKAFKVDAGTRALFTFDRSFTGVSGGGFGFIDGTFFARADRVDHKMKVKMKGEGVERTVQYWPEEIADANDPFKVLSNLNYKDLPTAEDFRTARARKEKSVAMKDGDVLRLDCPAGTVPDFVEIANDGAAPLVYPAVVNKGEFDPRSFGDLADSLMNGREGLSDRERANAVFQFVLGASDYFMQHTITFPPDSDTPESVVYKALMMLNGYCGFECGPLNNMAANFLSCVARCPASGLAGYGHEFEQVHFDGKNHTYDLSAQKFFPAMDNETASCLGESEDQPGLHNRLGGDAGSFIRAYTRGYYANNPSYQEKVAMILNPGERFRVCQANDGHVNDLHIHYWAQGENPAKSSYTEDYTRETHATLRSERHFLTRMDRFFPHYLNGFVTFDGRPSAANPAFRDVTAGSFCYRVKSCYPIVHGEYAAELQNGRAAEVELSTDGGKTFRPVRGPLDYEVRARVAYLIRVKAPIADVKTFHASTEVMMNPRVATGRLHAGANELLFKCVDPAALGLQTDGKPSAAKVTLGWREAAKAAEVKGGVVTGTIPGLEKQVVFLDPAKPQTLEAVGFSARAKAESFVLRGAAGGGAKKGPTAKLADGKLTLAAAKGESEPSIACVRITDGAAVRDVYVVTSSRMRYASVAGAEALGGAKSVPAGADQVQPTLLCAKGGEGAKFGFAPVPAGKYFVYFADRFASDTASPGELNRQVFKVDWPGRTMKGEIRAGSAGNQGVNFYKARYGRLEGRANYKWDYVLDEAGYHPYFPRYKQKVLEFPADTSSFSFAIATGCEKGAELAAILVVPADTEREFTCELTKILCGMNTDPARF